MPEDMSRNEFMRGELTKPEGPTGEARVKVYTGTDFQKVGAHGHMSPGTKEFCRHTSTFPAKLASMWIIYLKI